MKTALTTKKTQYKVQVKDRGKWSTTGETTNTLQMAQSAIKRISPLYPECKWRIVQVDIFETPLI